MLGVQAKGNQRWVVLRLRNSKSGVWGVNRKEKGAWKAEIEQEKRRKIMGLKECGSPHGASQLPSPHQCTDFLSPLHPKLNI